MRRPHRTHRLLLLSCAILTVAPVGAQAATPAGWPFDRLQLGMRDDEGGAAALRLQTRLGLRYHYLSGGANTGTGWSTWAQGGGSFVPGFVDDSVAHGFVPVFSLYQLRESTPGNGMDEVAGVFANLGDRATMTAYLKDARLFFQKAGQTGRVAVLHVEPDLWGFVQRRGGRGAGVPVQVATTGLDEVKGLPNTAAGLAQAFVRLRDRYAPKVLLGYHLSEWGTGEDIADSDPSDARIDELAASASGFYRSLGAKFDLVFAEQDNRDSGYSEVHDGDGGRSRWDAGDFARQARFLRDVSSATNRSIVLWQLPLGNASQDNTAHHYRDNRVQTLLGADGVAVRGAYVRAGVIAMLFGKALPEATCACDDDGDGTDDDGGLFKRLADAVIAAGGGALPGGATTPPPQSPPPRTTAPSVLVKATAVTRRVARGSTARLVVRLTSREAAHVVVAVQLYQPGAGSTPTYQMAFRGQRLRAGVPRRYRVNYRVPASARTGGWKVKVGLFDPDFRKLLVWRPNAAAFTVR
ncbi:MAG: hypothetical protein JWO02_4335 [Solirubrobacterales bacterium]|nr:hypothetical protein [Solirubrobacterales bacterium]